MSLAWLLLAVLAATGPETDRSDPIVFPSAEVAFERGVRACEGLYSGAYADERSEEVGPFTRRGFYMSGSGDEAKVNMLMLSDLSHVYKASVSGSDGVVYVVLTESLRTCRIGSFDSAPSHAGALATLTDPKSGWVAVPTTSSSAAARMQAFEKDMGNWHVVLNLSWPVVHGTGPRGLTAMATMAASPGPAAAAP